MDFKCNLLPRYNNYSNEQPDSLDFFDPAGGIGVLEGLGCGRDSKPPMVGWRLGLGIRMAQTMGMRRMAQEVGMVKEMIRMAIIYGFFYPCLFNLCSVF